MEENPKKEEIKVQDRRHFDRDGNVVFQNEEKDTFPQNEAAEPPLPESPEKLDLIAILFTYVHTALIYLGDLPDPATNSVSQNLPGVQQMIDILDLMQEKTKGNLTSNEGKYLESAVFDLRMRFLQKANIIK